MSRYEQFDWSRLRLMDVRLRGCALKVADCLPLEAPPGAYQHADLPSLLDAVRRARDRQAAVILMMGGHPIKLGLCRFIVDLIERGWVTHVATNGAGIIHDFELALFGGTSEDVAKWIRRGQFGLWRETSGLNEVIRDAHRRGEGLGESVGRTIECERFAHRELSIAAAGWRCGIPVTSHVTLGADIIHSMENCDGAALGAASYTDFLIFARSVENLEGGVFLNVGSAVTGPEVYLKALSMARNVARQEGRRIRDITTAVFDLVELPDSFRDGPPSGDHAQYYYRPWKTILVRTVADGGRSYYFQGDHRHTLPALWHGLTNETACRNNLTLSGVDG